MVTLQVPIMMTMAVKPVVKMRMINWGLIEKTFGKTLKIHWQCTRHKETKTSQRSHFLSRIIIYDRRRGRRRHEAAAPSRTSAKRTVSDNEIPFDISLPFVAFLFLCLRARWKTN